MLTKENFQCDRYCGQCCKKLTIRVSKADIERIRKLGYKEEDFLERDLLYRNKFVLKRDKNKCVFIKKSKDGKYLCRIYKNRPKTCQQYPFFGNKNKVGSCLPNKMYPSAFVSFSSKRE
jgi:Fe-S-cluster containining protein|tara:strand:+ start:2053 stop:2409 length:357 start_codon:yes stop_codon:yes gene_type:complete